VTALAPEAQLFAEDFRVGERFSGVPRAVGEAQFTAFAGITGDAHPIHYDADYAARTRFGRRLAHGLLVTGMAALGATETSRQLEQSLVAFLEQDGRFLAPVFIDDVLTSHFEVVAVERTAGGNKAILRLAVTLTNQSGETVFSGHHAYLLTCRPPAAPLSDAP
jgi:acyl dehydratase